MHNSQGQRTGQQAYTGGYDGLGLLTWLAAQMVMSNGLAVATMGSENKLDGGQGSLVVLATVLCSETPTAADFV